jgi:hypothetical protein
LPALPANKALPGRRARKVRSAPRALKAITCLVWPAIKVLPAALAFKAQPVPAARRVTSP